MAKKIYLVRHGQSIANQEGTVGDKDTPLSDIGLDQARQLTQRFSAINIDCLQASDFKRAKQTIDPIAATKNLPVTTNALFGEFFEPSPFGQLKDTDKEVVSYRFNRDQKIVSDPNWQYVDGETIGAFLKRIEAAKTYLEKLDAENVLVVSHGYFIYGFLSALLHNSFQPSEAWLYTLKMLQHHNTGVSLLQYKNEHWKIIMLNDHAHFAE
ncbi:MAG: hypothetical protein RLZZ70_685 [Candidatus Parcubacteria bacterium]|jgi:probable phosphoglycerate mutase